MEDDTDIVLVDNQIINREKRQKSVPVVTDNDGFDGDSGGGSTSFGNVLNTRAILDPKDPMYKYIGK